MPMLTPVPLAPAATLHGSPKAGKTVLAASAPAGAAACETLMLASKLHPESA